MVVVQSYLIVTMNQASFISTPIAPNQKRIGGYLIDAGLLTPAQVDVALNDQKMTGMRFGEILATRGWVKQQTIEYLMAKVIVPERRAATGSQSSKKATVPGRATEQGGRATDPGSSGKSSRETNPGQKPIDRRSLPISKPLPSVNSVDDDVSWV
ncbi:MAG TPA: hypothetical protein V6C46_01385, partial [Coleofasciculaceae cyanobacterium]